jgi:hypothetical protein
MIARLQNARGNSYVCADGSFGYGGSGDGPCGDAQGEGFGDSWADGCGDSVLFIDSGMGDCADMFLACPEPSNLTYLVINTLCRMQP